MSDLRKMGQHVNGVPVRLLFPASLIYTRESHLYVKGIGVLPLHQREQAERQFPGEVEVIREEYQVADRGRR
jgi:hypothetical protein